jgi:hypothetical protein
LVRAEIAWFCFAERGRYGAAARLAVFELAFLSTGIREIMDNRLYSESAQQRDSWLGGLKRLPARSRQAEKSFRKVVAILGLSLV